MATNILQAFVSLFADDSQLRASFQGLAPAALLAGKTTGERYAEGITRAASKAHEAFRKEFIGPLSQVDTTIMGERPGRRPEDQYRASDLAAHKGMAIVLTEQKKKLEESRNKAEAWGLSAGEATRSAKLFAGTLVSAVNPELGAMVQAGGEAVRALKGLPIAFTAAGTAAAIATVGVAIYIGRVKEAVDAKARLDAAVFAKDPNKAQAEVERRTAAFDDLVSKKEQAAQRTGGVGLIFRQRERSFEELIAFYSVAGKSVDEERKKIIDSQTKNEKLTREFTFPQIDARATTEANQLLVQEIGLRRQSAGTVDELTDSTQRLRAAKEALVEAAIQELEVGERVKTQNAFDAAAKRGTPVSQDVQDKILGDITRRQNNLRAAGRAVDLEDARQATRDIIALEEQQMAHSVDMGRVTMQAELEFQRAAMVDPRRTLKEQQDAEKKLFQGQRSMADELLKFKGNLGQSTWTEQLEIQRGFLSEMAAGSRPWLEATAKIADTYRAIREQAQGVLSNMVSIVAAETSRADAEQQRAAARKASEADEAAHVSRMARSKEADALTRRQADAADSEIERFPPGGTVKEREANRRAAQARVHARAAAAQAKEEEVARDEAARQRQRLEAEAAAKQREEAGKVSLRDFPSILRDARQRDANALRGDRVPIADLGAAVGRVDFWKTVDKEKLSPDVAVARLMEDPSAKLARVIEGLAGGAGDVTPVFSRMTEAGNLVVEMFLRLAGAPAPSGGPQQRDPGFVKQPPGGPPLSDENRQAILNTISTQLQDENLAVYGRR